MMINDRKNFEGLDKDVITTIDKLDKIGDKGVTQELVAKGVSEKEAVNTLKEIKNKKPTPDLEEIFKYLKQLGVREDEYQFVPTLARGLDYYTGTIFELKVGTYGLSVGGGGRYDNLIGMFVYPDKGGVKKQIPAVGFGLGLDRLLEILNL